LRIQRKKGEQQCRAVEAVDGAYLSRKRQRGVCNDATPQNGVDVKKHLIFAVKGYSKMCPYARNLVKA
jgi:hypothetical protein